MKIINAASPRHRQQMEHLALFLNLTSIECIDRGHKEELILTRADGQTLRLHAASMDKGGFFAVDVPGMKPLEGMPGPEAAVTLSPLSLVAEERVLKGSYMGSCVPSRDIPRYIDLFRRGKLPVDRLLTHELSLEGLNGGFDRLADGEALRQVLVF